MTSSPRKTAPETAVTFSDRPGPDQPDQPDQPDRGDPAEPESASGAEATSRPDDGPSAGERATLGGVLALAAVLSLWRLDRNGYANGYYAAAVRSMSQSWHNFFYGAFDPAGFITVDKPPLAFWFQAISVKIFGFNSWSLLVPQALASVASVYVLYRIVRGQAGALAGLVAALALTLTPITVAVSRDNLPEPTMILLLLLAAWAVAAAISRGRFRLLAAASVFVGLAFTTKMLQAYLVVPGLALAFVVTAVVGWRKRVIHLLGAGVIMVAVSATWMTIVDLTPKADRPYVGSSTNDTVRQLVFGWNGLGRVFGGGSGAGGSGSGGAAGAGANLVNTVTGDHAGIGRLFDGRTGGQIAWLIPFAALALVSGLVLAGRRPRVDPVRSGLLMWGGWAVGCWAVFSLSTGLFEPYYTAELAPALAALTGIGMSTLIGLVRRPAAGDVSWPRAAWAGGLLAVGALGSAAVEGILLGRAHGWNSWLRPTVLALAAVVTLGVGAALIRRLAPAATRRLVTVTGALAVLAVLAGPAAYAVTPVQRPVFGALPTAGPPAAAGADGTAKLRQLAAQFGGGSLSTALTSYLEKHQGTAKYLVAVNGATAAEPTIISTGKAVMAMGGYTRMDPVPTVAQLRNLVARGELRYVLLDGFSSFGQGLAAQRAGWVRRACTVVNPVAYGGKSSANAPAIGAAPARTPTPRPGAAAPSESPTVPRLSPSVLAFLNSQSLYDCT
ncbi:MAG: glycosyltransferase family 39 protein [Frankia sp.]